MVEILWEVSGGEVHTAKLGLLHSMKVALKETLTPKVLTEEEPVRGIDLPPFKFVAAAPALIM
jgi:hypothetical protein